MTSFGGGDGGACCSVIPLLLFLLLDEQSGERAIIFLVLTGAQASLPLILTVRAREQLTIRRFGENVPRF